MVAKREVKKNIPSFKFVLYTAFSTYLLCMKTRRTLQFIGETKNRRGPMWILETCIRTSELLESLLLGNEQVTQSVVQWI